MKYQSLFQKETANIKRYYKNKDSPIKRYIVLVEKYIEELESSQPSEIIEQFRYSELFRQLLSHVDITFSPDHFDSYFGGLLQIFDIDFMEWLEDHSKELKRHLTWDEIWKLNTNYTLNKILNGTELTLKETWNYDRTGKIAH